MAHVKRPVRMRAYYRALKNKSSPHHEWADGIEAYNRRGSTLVYALALTYRCVDLSESIYSGHPLLELLPKSYYSGFYYPVPVKYHSD